MKMKKNTKIHIKISSEDKEKLRKKAENLGLTLTSYCMMVLRKAEVLIPKINSSKN